jgi:predicted ribosome quality control (RQC) complex YloA/Tae2 family protein
VSKGKSYRTFLVLGFEVLVGKGDTSNDILTFEVAEPQDVWLHVAGVPGSHVVVRNPEGLEDVPLPVLRRAAELAAFYSKARDSTGKVEVSHCRVLNVRKRRGLAAGEVEIQGARHLSVYAREPADE